jgi:predicted phosphodiesterase
VVCISDTHNTRPEIPIGDILIHAGDLTENGSFDEVQAELSWLSSQPHKYKILTAGNHDVLLDDAFLAKHPERRYGQSKTKDDLDWGSVIYLQDGSVTLEFPSQEGITDKSLEPKSRKLVIFGSPWTPQYGISAFQYRPDDETHWAAKFASLYSKPDIVVTHGPPKHHLDARDFYRAGCPYLAEEIARIRPRLVVFGHIHASYGREDVFLDGVQRGYEEVMTGWSGWERIVWMAALVLLGKMRSLFAKSGVRGNKATTFVNAAVVGGAKNELCNKPISVKI